MRVDKLLVVDEVIILLPPFLTSEQSLSIHIKEYLSSPVSTISRLMLAEQVRVMLSTPPTSSKSGDIVTETSGAGTTTQTCLTNIIAKKNLLL